MVDAVGRNTSGRWEDRLWTGRDRGREKEGEREGGEKERERGGEGRGRRKEERGKEGGENLVTFVAGCASYSCTLGMACSMSQLR